MKITIRLSTEASYSVTVSDACTVDELLQLARASCPDATKLPASFKLIHNGERLAPGDQHILHWMAPDADATVILMSEGCDNPLGATAGAGAAGVSHTTAPAKKRKARCTFQTCKALPLRNVGLCSYCSGKFCAKHRLLEDHICQGLQHCKDNAHEKNAMKLQSEKTIASRV
ncbi:uncharacterized protein CANTADRAFT_89371 [Suhomyces tanzawaensis NRRL Y-17324]|uniref:AN1-type domain-containing protein n=1 Tax=Suhomyces tanzawaensis NRRL Y-17324 TaxID=984487 RepID=A0A1E4SJR7_9ASCO|nr:uncharacterized protein CANTADRAFT_89371 [Suhomyces tanzawaensis NRRL Y-17324]ODV79738.1 hypothetical protein CANTADRAFT_89371 [Suhomyces tanzawaensis NRRL Y-17324]